MGDLFDLYDPVHDYNDYDDPNGELTRRLERDQEKELHGSFVPRRLRSWTPFSFRPAKPKTEATTEIRRAS